MNETIHIMGIRGAGASFVAAIADASGYKISGSDQADFGDYDAVLEKLRIPVQQGFETVRLEGLTKLIYTPAVVESGEGTKLIEAAKKAGTPTFTWQAFLGQFLLKDKFVIGVTGTNGKSTTTAMVGLILEKAGLDPTVALGAVVPAWQGNYRLGQSKYFVIEADDAYGSFWNYSVNIAAVTNIKMDHPEFYPDFKAYQDGFTKFIANSKPNSILMTGPEVILKNPNGRTVAFDSSVQLTLSIPGQFNQENATLAYMVARELGINNEVIKNTLANFTGLKRRFEFKGNLGKTKIFEDYAHHPDAVEKTLTAFSGKFPNQKILVVFQPHLFSRTKALEEDFVRSFAESKVDQVALVDIYAAREVDRGEVNSKQLADQIGEKAVYVGSEGDTFNYLRQNAKLFDIVVIMGAGDINKILPSLLK